MKADWDMSGPLLSRFASSCLFQPVPADTYGRRCSLRACSSRRRAKERQRSRDAAQPFCNSALHGATAQYSGIFPHIYSLGYSWE